MEILLSPTSSTESREQPQMEPDLLTSLPRLLLSQDEGLKDNDSLGHLLIFTSHRQMEIIRGLGESQMQPPADTGVWKKSVEW